MNNTTATPTIEAVTELIHEQLTLLPSADFSPRFQLSRETRERGLRHIAEIRQMLAERGVAHDVAA